MPTLVIFVTLAIILAILLAVIVLLPWLRTDNSAQNNQLIALNIDLFKARLEELKADFHKKQINETEFKVQKTELERQLLLATDDNSNLVIDSSDTDSVNVKKVIPSKEQELKFTRSAKARLTLLICIPILIILGYFLAADRTSVMQLWQSQDSLEEVVDEFLTGEIDDLPEWATTDLVSLMAVIQTNVHQNAYDVQRWMKLSEILIAFEAPEPALEALERAYRLQPNDEDVAIQYAQTKFLISGGTIDSNSKTALNTVLAISPNNQRAKLLMAMGELSAGNYEVAQEWIDKLRNEIMSEEGDHSVDIKVLDDLSKNISDKKLQALEASRHEGTESNSLSANDKTIYVTVSLNGSLIPLVDDSDVLFVTVKPATGGAPLAVKRLDATQLKSKPQGITLSLSDNDAMMPTHTISQAMDKSQDLVVTARISKSGQAISESGDLSAVTKPLDLYIDPLSGEKSDPSQSKKGIRVAIEINQQVP